MRLGVVASGLWPLEVKMLSDVKELPKVKEMLSSAQKVLGSLTALALLQLKLSSPCYSKATTC